MAIHAETITLEAFLELPEEKPAFEFLDGVVTQKAWPGGRHSLLQARLAHDLSSAGEPGRLALAFLELQVTFSGASLVPDLAVYRWERIPLDASGTIADDFTEPPDIVFEIASSDDSVGALVRKCLWYVANGVQVALLVDPTDETVFGFRPGGRAIARRDNDVIDLSPVLPNFQLTARELFDSLQIGA